MLLRDPKHGSDKDWFPRFHGIPDWYIENRVDDGVRMPASVWRQSLNGLCTSVPPDRGGNDHRTHVDHLGCAGRAAVTRRPGGVRRRHPRLATDRVRRHRPPSVVEQPPANVTIHDLDPAAAKGASVRPARTGPARRRRGPGDRAGAVSSMAPTAHPLPPPERTSGLHHRWVMADRLHRMSSRRGRNPRRSHRAPAHRRPRCRIRSAFRGRAVAARCVGSRSRTEAAAYRQFRQLLSDQLHFGLKGGGWDQGR